MDITRDVMQMSREGKSVEQMRAVIVERYGRFGPSTDRESRAQSAPSDSSSPPTGRAGTR